MGSCYRFKYRLTTPAVDGIIGSAGLEETRTCPPPPPPPFLRTFHFRVFPTLLRLPRLSEAWNIMVKGCLYFLEGANPPPPKKKNLHGFVWSYQSITGLISQRQLAPKCSFLTSRPLGSWTLFFHNYPNKSHNFRNDDSSFVTKPEQSSSGGSKMARDFCKAVSSALFEYDTSKVVHIQSKTIGIINRLVQLTIICYIIV